MWTRDRDLQEALRRERPVVVMGRGHSGTRVLAWALEALGVAMGTLPEKATGDVQDRRFSRTIKRLAIRALERPFDAPPRPGETRRFRRAVARYRTWLATHGSAVTGWGWKFPETYLIGPLIDAVFPEAKHIHMVRDGRDLAFKEHLTDDAERKLGHALLRHLKVLDAPHHLQAAHSWEFQVRRFHEFARARLGDRCHFLSFEMLVAQPIEAMEGVARFLDVPMTDACREYMGRHINPAKIAQYLTQDDADIHAVEQVIGATLEACGYTLGVS
ncbi:MAG: sulfotransferase [Planctomycetes bacterium]|nr:sulfotransferase [Planctomycetota bacterium]